MPFFMAVDSTFWNLIVLVCMKVVTERLTGSDA